MSDKPTNEELKQRIEKLEKKLMKCQSEKKQLKMKHDALHKLSDELELKVEEQSAGLIEANKRFESLLHSIPDLVAFKDASGRYLLMNPAVEKFIGKSQNELIGKTVEDLLPSETAVQCRQSDEKAMMSLGPTHYEEFIEKGEERIFLDTIKAPVRDDDGNIQGLVMVSRDITERKQAEAEKEKLITKLQEALDDRKAYQAQLQIQALYDPLTHLPNRRLFFDRLNMALKQNRRNNSVFSVFFLDLDGLKSVNDSLGHKAGDEVLCAVARLLEKPFRKSDTVARFGGDEFTIIVDQLKSAQDAKILAEKVMAAFTTPIKLKTGSVNIGVSIGISLFPLDSDEAEELVRLADKSMYTSKQRGKNTYTLFCEDTSS